MPDFYPELIEILPDADIPFKGVQGKLLQAGDYQVVFMEIEPIGEVAPHSHGAQFGFVLEGEMDLTIGGETKTMKQGDHYYIPAGVTHSATFRTKVFVMDMFAEPDRYSAKS